MANSSCGTRSAERPPQRSGRHAVAAAEYIRVALLEVFLELLLDRVVEVAHRDHGDRAAAVDHRQVAEAMGAHQSELVAGKVAGPDGLLIAGPYRRDLARGPSTALGGHPAGR